MFEDFDPSATGTQTQKRFRRSLVAAAAIVSTTIGAILATATATTKAAEAPEPVIVWRPPVQEPVTPPSPPKTKVKKGVATKRPPQAPKHVPQDKQQESDAALAAAEVEPVENPGDSAGTGHEVGTRPVPPPPPPPVLTERLTPPVLIFSGDRPRYPLAARRKGIEGTVVVAFDVLENGHVANVRVLSGPKELHESVLEAASSWRYRPARRNGKPVRYAMTRAVVFRLEDASR